MPGKANPTPSMAVGYETAKLLLDIAAVNFRPDEPYRLTAGWASPVYIDCRWVISFPEARRRIVKLGIDLLNRDAALPRVDMIAGGETAGIPYAAWIAAGTDKPMLYVRKQPKGFGRDAQIEGSLSEGASVLLVEDLATDGSSKINFINALRAAGAVVTDLFVVFFYNVFPGALEVLKDAGVHMHYLTTWQDILAVADEGNYFDKQTIDAVREFLADPVTWSGAHGAKGTE